MIKINFGYDWNIELTGQEYQPALSLCHTNFIDSLFEHSQLTLESRGETLS